MSVVLSKDEILRRALQRSEDTYADETTRSYATAWAQWCAWSREPWPLDPDEVIAWLEHLVIEGASRATVDSRLSALVQYDRELSASDAWREHRSIRAHPKVRRWLAGFRRSTTCEQRQAAPLDRSAMLALVRCGDAQARRGSRIAQLFWARDKAMLLVGWLGALRRRELAALRCSDVAHEPQGLVVHVRRAKTDQEGRGAYVNIHRQSSELCAAAAWQAWMEAMDGAKQRKPILPHIVLPDDMPAWPGIDRTTGELSAHGIVDWTVNAVVKRRAQDAGLSSAISAHSLRAGLVTEAHAQRKSEADVQRHGRWKSVLVMRRYVRRQHWQGNPTEGLT